MTSAHGSVAVKSSVGWLARCGAPRSPEVSGKITVLCALDDKFCRSTDKTMNTA
jgi:hypothetical protein